jgi:DNA-binding CsgD family transcriptional regulator
MAKSNVKSIQEEAARSHSPRQFKRLLGDVRSVIPYRGLACMSCNPINHRFAHLIDIDYPRRYMGWYLATGMYKKDPILEEWMRTRRPQLRSEIMQRFPERFDPEHIKRIEEFHLDHEIQGGMLDQERAGVFSLILDSDEEARAHLEPFAEILPSLFRALSKSYRYPLLTDRKKMILLRRAQGTPPRQIAQELGISERTVKMHLEEIRKKLYADDVVSAVWIAGQIGLIGGSHAPLRYEK